MPLHNGRVWLVLALTVAALVAPATPASAADQPTPITLSQPEAEAMSSALERERPGDFAGLSVRDSGALLLHVANAADVSWLQVEADRARRLLASTDTGPKLAVAVRRERYSLKELRARARTT